MSQWLKWAERIQVLSQTGLTHTQDESDRERYEELQQVAKEMLTQQHLLTETRDSVERSPKLDVRGVVFNGDRIMLIQVAGTNLWALPGGPCELDLTPAETIIGAVEDVSGFDVVPVRLLALFDMRQHPHPTGTEQGYKLVIECALIGGEQTRSASTEKIGFFRREELPELALSLNTVEQLHMCFDAHWQEDDWTTLFD